MSELRLAGSEFPEDFGHAHRFDPAANQRVQLGASRRYFDHFLALHEIAISTCRIVIISLPVQNTPTVYRRRFHHRYFHGMSDVEDLLDFGLAQTFNVHQILVFQSPTAGVPFAEF